MDTKSFSYFTSLARHHSLTRAAKELGITPQGLGGAMRRLDQELGVHLWSGAPGTSPLTEHGKLFLTYAQDFECDLRELRRGLDAITTHASNVIRLGCSVGLLGYLGEEVIENFNRNCSSCQVLACEELPDVECARHLAEGDYDYALLVDPVSDAFEATTLVEDYQFFWVNASDPLARKGVIHLSDLQGRTILTMGDDYQNTSLLVQMLAQAHVDCDVRFTGEMIRVYEYARAGKALGLTCRNHIEATAESSKTVGVPIKELPWGFSICSRQGVVPTEAQQWFLTYMRSLRRSYR